MKLLLSALLCLLSATSSAQITSDDSLATLKQQIQSRAIASVVVLHMPDDVLTRVAVTPELMWKWAETKVILDDAQRAKLQSLIDATNAKPSPEKSDLRWGILFYNSSGIEIASVFVDHFGQKGYVNNQPVQFSKNLSTPLHLLIRAIR
jgi:hypothetical protein